MSLRPKTVRRLAILSAATFVTAGSIGYVWHRERQRGIEEIADARRNGFEALRHGQHEQAMEDLRRYVTAHPDDVAALFALAQARLSVPEQNNSHLGEARQLLLQVLALDPKQIDARRQLMSLYARARFWKELQEQAETMLAQSPNDPPSLRYRAQAISTQNRPAEALSAWINYVNEAPNDIPAQLEALAAMRKAGKSLDDVSARANQLVSEHADDARFLILKAWTCLERKETTQALELLDQVSQKARLDVDLARIVLDQYDRTGEFDRASALLERSASLQHDPKFSAILIDRLYQRGRFDLCIERIDAMDASIRELPRNQAIKALSLRSLGKPDQAGAIELSLAHQLDNIEAQYWARVLQTQLDDSMPVSKRLETLRDALTRWPEESILLMAYGQALAEVNEYALALSVLEDAARRAPAWPLPHQERARLFMQIGDLRAARAASSQALRRAPNQLAGIVQRIRVEMAVARSTGFTQDQQELLGLLDQLKSTDPNSFELNVYRIELLLRSGQRQEALNCAQRLTSTDVILNRFAAESLAAVGRIDAEVHQRLASSMKSVALTSDVLLSISSNVNPTFNDNLTEDERRLFNARVMTLKNEAGAPQAWRDLVGSTNSEEVLTAALVDGFDAMDQTTRSTLIERVKGITGPDAFNWRLAKMKWLLRTKTESDTREAVVLGTDLVRAAPQLVEARRLLASALLRTGNTTFALQHLREAVRLDPANFKAVSDLVLLNAQSGTSADNKTILTALAEQSQLDPSSSISIARLLLANEMKVAAQQFLARAAAVFALDHSGELLLAELDSTTNRQAEARTIYDRLLLDDPTAEALASATIFFRKTGDISRADVLFAQLSQLAPGNSPASAALARVQFESGNIDAARSSFKTAMTLSPNDRNIAQRAVEFEIEIENYNGAATLAGQLLNRFVEDSTLLRLRATAQALGTGIENVAALDRLIDLLQSDPQSADQIRVLRAMSLLSRASTDDVSARAKAQTELASALEAMARKNPTSLALQTRAIDALFTIGNGQSAAELAQIMLTSKPNDASFVALATQTFKRARMMDEARKAAQIWKKIAGVDPIEPDLILAELQLPGAPIEALKTISGYVPQLVRSPDARPAALWLYASALVANNRVDEACAWIDQLLDRSKAARATAPMLARSLGNVTAARSLLKRAGALTTQAEDATHFAIASAWLSLAQQTGSASDAESALALAAPEAARDNASSNWLLASAEAQRIAGRVQSAEDTLRRALLRYPDDSNLLNALAWLLYSTNRSGDEARNLVERAIQTDSTSVSAYDTAGRIALAMNRTADAERYFRRALTISGDNIDVLLGLATLQKTRGQQAAANQTIAKIEQLMSDRNVARRLSAQTLEQFNSLRSAMSSAD